MKKLNLILMALAVMMMLFVGCPNETGLSEIDNGKTTTTIEPAETNYPQHTIAYCNLNDNGTAVMSVYAENENVVLQDIPRTGYTFRGWFDGTTDAAQKVTGWEAGTHKDNVVLWAKWEPISVTVTLINGDDAEMITATYGDYLPNVNVPTKSGSIFTGYYTEKNRSGLRYIDQDGQGYRIFKSTTAMILYAGWTEISSGDGNSVTNVIGLTWKGSLDAAPSSPETGWAYYNTADKKSYIFDGAQWQIIAQDGDKGDKGEQGDKGDDGDDGKDADVWTIGDDGYWYLNGVKTEYQSKGADGQNGQDGQNGNDGISIVWQGNLASAPDSPQAGWAYYNAVDKKSYIWNGSAWNLLAQDGANGGDGQGSNTTINVCVTWKGSFETAPSNAQAGWAYYNTADKKSYIYDGSAWNILAQDGADGQNGQNGQNGQDANIWTIGDDGYWYLNGVKTEYSSKGADGQNGQNGQDGQDANMWTIGNDGYWYLNGEKTEYMSKGADGQNGQNGQDGQNGTNGADGTSIVWKGSLTSAPGNPQTGWAYYNTADKKSYIYDGTNWNILAQDGADGQDGQDGQDATGDSNLTGYKVVFYANGGIGTMANMNCQFDTEYALPECGFTAPTGMKFSRWDRGGVGATFTNLAVNPGDVVVIGAKWIARYEYNIIYHNVDDCTNDNPSVFNNQEQYVNLKTPKRADWYFLGWYDNENFEGSRIKSLSVSGRTEDIELWAKWTNEPGSYTVLDGVYSFSGDIANISGAWGGSQYSPQFSIVLMDQIAIDVIQMGIVSTLQEMPAGSPVYQMVGMGNITFPTVVDGIWETKYNGVAVEVSEGRYTLYVKGDEINVLQLRGLGRDFDDGEKPITEIDDVDLSGYQPVVIALSDNTNDSNGYIGDMWAAKLNKMTPGATYPDAIDPPALVSFSIRFTGTSHIDPVDSTFEYKGDQTIDWVVSGVKYYAGAKVPFNFYADSSGLTNEVAAEGAVLTATLTAGTYDWEGREAPSGFGYKIAKKCMLAEQHDIWLGFNSLTDTYVLED